MNLEEKMDEIVKLGRKANHLGLDITVELNRRGLYVYHFQHNEKEAVLIREIGMNYFLGKIENHKILNEAILYLTSLIKEKAPQGLASE